MKSIFGGLGGKKEGNAFEPSYETCSDEEVDEVAAAQLRGKDLQDNE